MIVVAFVSVALTLALTVAGAETALAAPTVELGPEGLPDDFEPEETALPIGWLVPVTGTGWPADQQLEVAICGRGGLGGSADCHLDSQQTIQAGPDGSMRTSIRLAAPPAPCPCVVEVTSRSTGQVARTPIRVRDHPFVELVAGDRPTDPVLVLGEVKLTDRDAWLRWFGGPPRYTLTFAILNTGDASISDATMSVTAGPGDDPTGLVSVPELGVFEPGESRSFSVPVELDALTIGKITVSGELNGPVVSIPFTIETSTYPWALILIPLVVAVQLLLLLARNVLRRAVNRRAATQRDRAAEEIERLDELVAFGELDDADIRQIAAHLNDRTSVTTAAETEAEDPVESNSADRSATPTASINLTESQPESRSDAQVLSSGGAAASALSSSAERR